MGHIESGTLFAIITIYLHRKRSTLSLQNQIDCIRTVLVVFGFGDAMPLVVGEHVLRE